MYHFFFAIYSVVFTTLSGILLVVIIVAGYFSWPAMIAAMISGGILSLPITYKILKQMDWSTPDPRHAAKPARWYIR
jgi:Kef-type K+ transport system membrane component KefB